MNYIIPLSVITVLLVFALRKVFNYLDQPPPALNDLPRKHQVLRSCEAIVRVVVEELNVGKVNATVTTLDHARSIATQLSTDSPLLQNPHDLGLTVIERQDISLTLSHGKYAKTYKGYIFPWIEGTENLCKEVYEDFIQGLQKDRQRRAAPILSVLLGIILIVVFISFVFLTMSDLNSLTP